MNKNDAELRADELRRLIDYHNQKYYNEDSPEIDDFEYDKLLRELENIEAEYPELITTNSPTQKSEEMLQVKNLLQLCIMFRWKVCTILFHIAK